MSANLFPERVAQVVYWTSLPISLLGIAQALVPGKLDFGLQALGKMAAFSTLGNPQFVAVWLVFSIPLYPALARTRPDARARLPTARPHVPMRRLPARCRLPPSDSRANP